MEFLFAGLHRLFDSLVLRVWEGQQTERIIRDRASSAEGARLGNDVEGLIRPGAKTAVVLINSIPDRIDLIAAAATGAADVSTITKGLSR